MAPTKLIAEWFWVDRWTGSTAFALDLEARGLYREMLSQAWRRGGRLPSDHQAIRRLVGASEKEWKRTWPKVEPYWRLDGDHLVNDTQLKVYADAIDKQAERGAKARSAARARWQKHAPGNALGNAQASAQASTQAMPEALPEHMLEQCPPSPSPIPSVPLDQRVPISPPQRVRPGAPGALAGALPRDHIGHGWCGARFCLSAKEFNTLVRRYGDGGEAAVTQWLAQLDAGLGPSDSPGGPVWVLQHFDAWLVQQGRMKPAPRPVAAAAPSAVPGVEETRRISEAARARANS